MGVYDEYGYLGIQIKINANGKRYKIGDIVPLTNGLYFGHEGVMVIDGLKLAAVYPYDEVWDKWGNWIGKEVKAVVESSNPISAIVAAYAETKPTKESSMKPYWMVHRYGRQSGPANKVHHSFNGAYAEAKRLARKENDRFVILQAHTLIEPFKPLVITVETIGNPPAFIRSGDTFPEGPPEETEPTEAPCGYGCDDEHASSNCEVHAEPEPCPAVESSRADDCTCSPRVAVTDMLECDEPNAPLPKMPCPCGCNNQGNPSTIAEDVLTPTALYFDPNYMVGCPCNGCSEAVEKAMDALRIIVTPIPTIPNCECLACTTGVVPDLSTSKGCTFGGA